MTSQCSKHNNVNLEDRNMEIEEAIKRKQKSTDFDIREFPISVIVEKYTNPIPEINNKTEIFIPDYQREYKWSIKQQSEFIESLMIDLPVPYIYVSDISEGDDEGRIEIIDGSQRIRTLARFLTNKLTLSGLKLVPELNNIRFEDLPGSRQLRFKRKTVRFIELMGVDEEARRQIFYRLNSGGVQLNEMEIRFGTSDGEFLSFISRIIKKYIHQLQSLAPMSKAKVENREYEEILLRFFAYRFDMDSYRKEVSPFLTTFMEKMNGDYEYKEKENVIVFDEEKFERELKNTLDFVEEYFAPFFFKKEENNTSISRIRFESISVGVALAIASEKTLNTNNILSWLKSNDFSILTESDASNSRPKLIDRTYFVVNKLTGEDWKPTSKAFIKALDGADYPFLEQESDEDEDLLISGVQNELF